MGEMQYMFTNATLFNQNIAPWNTDKVTSTNAMFAFATSFNQNVCNWLDNTNFPDNIDTAYMFYGSGCDVTSDPSISRVCQFCPSLSPSSSNRPTTTPLRK